jgi:hypothetical protein
MKNWIITAAVSLMVFTGGCVTTLQVAVEPNIGKMSFAKPFPLKGALYIPTDTRNYRYKSPDYIPSKPVANWESIRPFELPVGEAFAQAANQTFSQLFQEIQVIPHYSGEDIFPLVVAVSMEEFRLTLEYATFGYRPRGVELLDVQGIIKARVRLIRPGRSPWEKVYEVPVPPDRLAVNPWTQEAVGKRVGEALNALFAKITWEIVEESNLPREPLHQWLTR